jgi:hypothetical protein
MKTFGEDKELRLLLKSIKLDKPAPEFTNHVMTRVFQGEMLIEQVKAEPILGKGFWIILALFGILMAAMVFVSTGNVSAESTFLLPDISSREFMSDYRLFFNNLKNLPASIAGISMAFSLLIFVERFLSAKSPKHA